MAQPVTATAQPVETATPPVATAKAPAEADEPLTRPIVNVRSRGGTMARALRFCELAQIVTFERRDRVYCLHLETISFDRLVTALGEVMNDRFGLKDAGGNELVYDNNRRCDFNLCYAHVWYDANDERNAYALLRLFPVKLDDRQVAPLLELEPGGDPGELADWQVVLVDATSGEVARILDDPFVPMARGDIVAFNALSGYFEVLEDSGRTPRATGKRLGMQLTNAQAGELTAVVDGIALFDFNDADAAYLTAALAWVKTHLPAWHSYLLEQRPFEVYREPSLPFVSDGFCCRIQQGDPTYGRIRFRDHLDNWTRDSFPGESHDSLARWSLLTLLLHEATHVRDLRTDRFRLRAVPLRMRDCVMHISTDEIEVLFSREASAVRVSANDSTQRVYAETIETFVREIEEKLTPQRQEMCGTFYRPAFDGLMP